MKIATLAKPENVTTNAITTRHEQENKLKQTFGLDRFYDDQWETIDRILKGDRV